LAGEKVIDSGLNDKMVVAISSEKKQALGQDG
jgi:hypothetical protein